jgi:hypothetical protein
MEQIDVSTVSDNNYQGQIADATVPETICEDDKELSSDNIQF